MPPHTEVPMHCRPEPQRPTRRAALRGLLAGGFAALSGCGWDGHFAFLGYTTRPNYDEGIRTIYVPQFYNKAFKTTPYRDIERDLTKEVINQIEWKTPFKVINNPNKADTELIGTVLTINKNLMNRTQQNEIREGQLTLAVELVWRDLRSGQIISNARRPVGVLPPPELPPFDPDNPPPPEAAEKPVPVLVTMMGRFLPEVGESVATAQKRVVVALATQIVHMMEKNWDLPPRPCP
jgi:hypothetical protein